RGCGTVSLSRCGVEQMQSAAAGKVISVIEAAPRDLAIDHAHLLQAQLTVLRGIGQTRVLLASDAPPREVKEQPAVLFAYGHDAPDGRARRRRCRSGARRAIARPE